MLFVCLYTCHWAGYSKGDDCCELPSHESQTPPTIEVACTDNIKCNTPPTERRSLIEKVREKTETAKQRGKQWVHWLTPNIESDDTTVTDEGDNNNTGTKEPAAVLAR